MQKVGPKENKWNSNTHLNGKHQLKELVADHISNLKGHFKSPKCNVLNQPDVKDTLHKLHANYVLVPADKCDSCVQEVLY